MCITPVSGDKIYTTPQAYCTQMGASVSSPFPGAALPQRAQGSQKQLSAEFGSRAVPRKRCNRSAGATFFYPPLSACDHTEISHPKGDGNEGRCHRSFEMCLLSTRIQAWFSLQSWSSHTDGFDWCPLCRTDKPGTEPRLS